MFYYLVWVRSNRYHGKEPLTYSFEQKLQIGSIVQVELQNSLVSGFIAQTTTAPRFKTKPIDLVYDLPPININLVKLAKWLIAYYPAPLGAVAQQFLPTKITTSLSPVSYLTSKSKLSLPNLTADQENVLQSIAEPNTYLLHGITGSGKTRIFIELTRRALAEGKSAIILTPEISLTSQLYNSFFEQFGKRVVLIHSRQSPKERQQAWLRCITSQEPLIVIGPRSAIFSPLKRLGLIVVDEAHENAYKQEQLPHYHTTRVASYLAGLSRAILIISSATPSIWDYFMADNKHKLVLKMDRLAIIKKTAYKKNLIVVDLKDKSNFNISNIISDQMIEAIKTSLASKEQSLIYLNRRGTSRLVFCQSCGWEAICPNCNLALVYHADFHQLRCHSCAYRQSNIPSICPNCDNDEIIYRTVGTKAIVDELSKLFVSAKVARFDTDNLKADSMAQNYNSVKAGGVDILVGTQMLAKGLDLPKLSTVGVLQADTSLYLPDFSSQERTFQLLTQVLGRVNRGHLEGRAVIQTYNPDSPLLRDALAQDYQAFYDNELEQRRKFKFPPYYNLLKLWCKRSSSKSAEEAAQKLRNKLDSLSLDIRIEGPAPAMHEKSLNKYQWQLVVKSTKRKHLIEVISHLPTGWQYDIDPLNLL